MKKTILLGGLTALALSGFTAGAVAQGVGEGPMSLRDAQPAVSELDADGDGHITMEEMTALGTAATRDRFAAADTDGDGVLTAAEISGWMEAMRAEREAERQQRQVERFMAQRDADDDGVLSIVELSAPQDRADRMFKRADQDEDGMISKEEFAAMQAQRADHWRARAGMHGHGARDGHGGHRKDHDGTQPGRWQHDHEEG